MSARYDQGGISVYVGDCREVRGRVAAIVTDPPYEIGFMGKKWDRTGVAFDPETWRRLAATLDPGGYLVAFGGARTVHRMAVAIEDAGMELRDTLMWLYGSGFPKSGAQLKPMYEPIILARRPGPLRMLGIDGCRIGFDAGDDVERIRLPLSRDSQGIFGDGLGRSSGTPPSGRWPGNVAISHAVECVEAGERQVSTGTAIQRNGGGQKIGTGRAYHGSAGLTRQDQGFADVDGKETVPAWECVPGCPVAELDRQSGRSSSTAHQRGVGLNGSTVYGAGRDDWGGVRGPADTGGASRFFYQPKASRRERGVGNDHPTVKPVALMQWLIRLVTAPGDLVFDPFMGSGSTLIAARNEGRQAVGVDSDDHAAEIAIRRLREGVPA